MGDELRSRLSDAGQAELQAPGARDPTPSTTRSCTRRGAGASVAVVVLGLLATAVIFIAARKNPPKTPTNDDTEYAIMLDAGSSGTRAHVYSWPASSSCPERIAQRQVTERGGDGKSTVDAGGLDVQTARGVAGYLQPLLEFAQETVPNDRWSATPIQLQATAGLRKMPGEHGHLQTTVLAGLRSQSGGAVIRRARAASAHRCSLRRFARVALPLGANDSPNPARCFSIVSNSVPRPFFAQGASSAAVIGGQEEGANEWVTVNYLRGTLGAHAGSGCFHPLSGSSNLTKAAQTAVTLGMGGASMQIAFAPTSTSCPLQDPSTAFCVAFEDDSHRMGLYVHSYLGLGQEQAQKALQIGLAAGGGDPAGQVGDACLLEGYTTTADVNGTARHFAGHGNAAACKASIAAHVVKTGAPCHWSNCAFDGVYQPRLAAGDLHLSKEFYEISGFWKTAVLFFGMSEGDTLGVLQTHGQRFCNLTWAEAKTQHPGVKEKHLAIYCFTSM